MGLRAAIFKEQLGMTCGECFHFSREGSAFYCPLILDVQRRRGLRVPDAHVTSDTPACDQYQPRFAVVEQQEQQHEYRLVYAV